MDWKLLGAAFTTIFFAEMGDKTQIAAFSLAGANQKPWVVFLGSSLALVTATALGVLFGNVVGKFIPHVYLKKCSTVLFIALGLWTWFKI